jgi:hypothetical protein
MPQVADLKELWRVRNFTYSRASALGGFMEATS